MFDKLFGIIDNIIGKLTPEWDKGTFGILLLIAIALLIIGVIVIIAVMLFPAEKPETSPKVKLDIIAQAPSYCEERGFNNWHWTNETIYEFECFNSTGNITKLDDYVRS